MQRWPQISPVELRWKGNQRRNDAAVVPTTSHITWKVLLGRELGPAHRATSNVISMNTTLSQDCPCTVAVPHDTVQYYKNLPDGTKVGVALVKQSPSCSLRGSMWMSVKCNWPEPQFVHECHGKIHKLRTRFALSCEILHRSNLLVN